VLIDPVLIDTGPPVAYFNKRDQYNAACAAALENITPPLFTSWPVLTKTCYLLQARGGGEAVGKLLYSCGAGFLEILQLTARDAHAIADFLRKYRDIKPDLADASIMHLAERDSIDHVFTIDITDFSIFRTSSGRSVELIPVQAK
jgi:predicted nucleic acid-binding protein